MEQLVRPSIRPEDIEEVWEIVERLTARKRAEQPISPLQARLQKLARAIRDHTVLGTLTLVGVVVLSHVYADSVWANVFRAISILIGLLAIACPLLLIGSAVPFLRQRYKTPFAQLHSRAFDDITLDLPAIAQLARCERGAVGYVLVQYRHRRQAFENRAALIAGPLSKIGLFPALGAFAIVAIKVWPIDSRWLHAMIFLIPAFYLVNFVDYELLEEMDRTIALLEYSETQRDQIGPKLPSEAIDRRLWPD
ncbi:hypothetical protein WK80_12305 [Burkholderia multivorans]|uniref:hypothetical protein n=1 Tax=Burkholderia multivorans TaxID=87883 RepID=UPI00075D6C4F|nr:hypothetical protein [Burkholderia multivorans]KVV29223.1 hypothetical protein WK80_12305 [Burkholderia multivorans]MBU9205368.1 hypothetical protein [Burkholderia multivorans]MCA8388261.1 hypothetical protein [Burkholderia multivorans]MCO8318715.1 hypothetical protein [Burkholderia multivorans]MCO8353376.1 hypothetical protein [Burkholderia multivorans]